jgi:hypothetical protein
MKPQAAFLWGCIAGVAPEELRWFKIFSTGSPYPQLDWILYFIFLVLYILLAGAVAFNPDGKWKALWVGSKSPVTFFAGVASVCFTFLLAF